jgi:ribulose-phosphate 3-epimerase
MSVEPGKSGQKFIENSLNKIAELKSIINQNNYKIKIEVDGGIDHTNVQQIYKAGADIVVMGSAVYKSENKKVYISKIKHLVSNK